MNRIHDHIHVFSKLPWCIDVLMIFRSNSAPEYFLDLLFSRKAVVAKQKRKIDGNFLENSVEMT